MVIQERIHKGSRRQIAQQKPIPIDASPPKAGVVMTNASIASLLRFSQWRPFFHWEASRREASRSQKRLLPIACNDKKVDKELEMSLKCYGIIQNLD